MVDTVQRKDFEFAFASDKLSPEAISAFETSLREHIAQSEDLYSTLMERAMDQPASELASRLEILTL